MKERAGPRRLQITKVMIKMVIKKKVTKMVTKMMTKMVTKMVTKLITKMVSIDLRSRLLSMARPTLVTAKSMK